jgi:two-component system, NtrC family, response regulator HydG
MPSILIVDDLISIHEMLEAVIQPSGFTTAFATDGEKALVRYKAGKFDLVLADIDMKPMDGITLLKQLKQYDPSAVVIIMTAYASTDSAIQALKFGAFDYLQKPFKVDELLATLRRGMEYRKMVADREALIQGGGNAKAGDFEAQFPGESQKIKRLVAQLKKLAASHTPVLITGEKGTGHEAAAAVLHAACHPEGSPYVAVDCQLSQPDAVQAGLIGPDGAGGRWVKQAAGGTLYLGNVQHLPKDAQERLVSVIRHCGNQFRLICATEEDLEKLTESGEFHEELFYRIAAMPVHLPALRERTEDIPALIKSIATRLSNPQYDARQMEFTEDALAALKAYAWPGNNAEFVQFISQIISQAEARVITSAQLPLRVRDMNEWPNLTDYLAGQEKLYRARVLSACKGDKDRAAKILGVSVEQLG